MARLDLEYFKGQQAAQRGKLDEAFRLLEISFHKYGNKPAAFNLAALSHNRQDYKGAQKYYFAALQNTPGFALADLERYQACCCLQPCSSEQLEKPCLRPGKAAQKWSAGGRCRRQVEPLAVILYPAGLADILFLMISTTSHWTPSETLSGQEMQTFHLNT